MPQQTPAPEPSKKSNKALKIVLIISGVLLGLAGICVLAYMWFFVGFTKQQKYEKCAKNCEEIMLLEADIPACKLRCEEITGYSPSTGETSDTSEEGSSTDVEDITYGCEWSWPQKIINSETEEVIYACTYDRPYCKYGDHTYENVACCEGFDEVEEEHLNCTPLSELL